MVGLRKPLHFDLLVFAIFGFLLIACSNSGEKQDEAALKRALKIDRVFHWVGFGFSGEITLRADQTAFVLVQNSGTDKGHWQVVDDAICLTLERVAEGKKQCATIIRQLDGSYQVNATPSGAALGVAKLKTDES